MASATVVDEQGIVPALGQAGASAIRTLVEDGLSLDGAVVVLDGSFDWLTRAVPASLRSSSDPLEVVVRVKADRTARPSPAASVGGEGRPGHPDDRSARRSAALRVGVEQGLRVDRALRRHPLGGCARAAPESWLHQATSVALDGFAELDALAG